MISVHRELGRLSHTLVWRGAAMLALGAVAVLWPEDTLIYAMLSAGVVAALFGLYEITIGLAVRTRAPHGWIVLLHGLASLMFGMLSVGATGLSFRLALSVIAAWMLFYAALSGIAAVFVWSDRAIRWPLIAKAGLDVALAIAVLAYPEATIFAMLFFGAAYAALFGAWQAAIGLWLRRALRLHQTAFRDGRLAVSS